MSRKRKRNRKRMPPPPRKKPQEEMLLSLCLACAQQFYDSPEHKIKRSDYDQIIKEECDYCAVRRGFSFVIIDMKG